MASRREEKRRKVKKKETASENINMSKIKPKKG